MLAPTDKCSPASRKAGRRHSTSREPASTASLSPSIRTANSSPPNRATVSLARIGAPQPLADPDHQLVPDRVPEGVVHRLEVVEVDEQQGQRAQVPPVLLQGMGHPVGEQRSVGQPGQLVGERLPLEITFAVLQVPGQRDVVPDRQVLPDQHADERQHHDDAGDPVAAVAGTGPRQ